MIIRGSLLQRVKSVYYHLRDDQIQDKRVHLEEKLEGIQEKAQVNYLKFIIQLVMTVTPIDGNYESKRVNFDQKAQHDINGDTQSVFEIRKLFKFGNEFGEFVKRDTNNRSKKSEQRPVSAYTCGIID